MKILMINVVCGIRSTGRICTDLALELEARGHEVKIAYGRENVPEQFQKYAVRIGNDTDVKLHALKARLFDQAGFGSRRVTEKFVEWVKKYNPDIIHLHNIHGYYINVEVLFKYLETCGKKIIWTLHDCWAFTGHCVYFDYAGCEKWKAQCLKCKQKKEYPSCYGISKAKNNYRMKQKLFTKIPNMTIITPSKWLQELVGQSYLKVYPVAVIYNGIDTDTFKPINSKLRQKYNLGKKKIILGVAAIWDKRKGLKYLLELADRLDDNYQVVIIGLNATQLKQIPEHVIGITKTNNVQELVEWYSTADIYVNPTLEDNYPTTNMEAICCGTPCLTFDTGGSPESARAYGKVVEKNIDALYKAIVDNTFIKTGADYSIKQMVEQYLIAYLQ